MINQQPNHSQNHNKPPTSRPLSHRIPPKVAVTGDRAVGLTLGSEPLNLRGGVMGANRVLSGLGPNSVNVFRLAWHLPPIFETPPTPQAGMQLSISLGVAIETAVQWAGGQSVGGARMPPGDSLAGSSTGTNPNPTAPAHSSSTAPSSNTTSAAAGGVAPLPPLGSSDLPDPELHPVCHPGPLALELCVKIKYDQARSLCLTLALTLTLTLTLP